LGGGALHTSVSPEAVALRPGRDAFDRWTEPRTLRIPLVAIIALCALGAAATQVLPASVGYDPWAWLIWGREILSGDLVTTGGPSWKPLPVIFTVPFSLAGSAAPDLWLATLWAGTAAALIPAARLGARLAGVAGGVLAATFLVISPWMWISVGVGFSEGLTLLCVLGALDRMLTGRHGQAYALGVAACLLRAEAFPFLAAYALWLLVTDRRRLPWLAAGMLLLPLLWLVPEQIGSGNWFRAADRAQQPGPNSPAFASRPAFAVIRQTVDNLPAVMGLGLLLGCVAIAARVAPRQALRPTTLLAAVAAVWLGVVALMAEAGFSGILRYVYVPLAIAHILSAAGIVWGVRLIAHRLGGVRAQVALAVLAAVLVAGLVHGVAAPLRATARTMRYDHAVFGDLAPAVTRAGGAHRLKACGRTYAGYYSVPAVAWALKAHLVDVGFRPRAPGVVLRARFPRLGPVVPPEGPIGRATNRRVLATTENWRVVAACG
jgi:hypothetical protein